MTNRMLLEAGYSRLSYYHAGGPGGCRRTASSRDDRRHRAVDGRRSRRTSGLRWAPRANYNYRALQSYLDNYGNPNHWRASASYVTGSHSMKVGYQGSFLIATQRTVTPDRPARVSLQPGRRRTPSRSGSRIGRRRTTRKVAALFVQDTWTRGRLTLQGALRYDRAWSYSPADGNGTSKTSIFNPQPISFDQRGGRRRLQRHHAAFRRRLRRVRQRQDGRQVQHRPLSRRGHERQRLRRQQPGRAGRSAWSPTGAGRTTTATRSSTAT